MSNYEKFPYIKVKNTCSDDVIKGYSAVVNQINNDIKNSNKEHIVVAIDLYPGVDVEVIEKEIVEKLDYSQKFYSDNTYFKTTEMVQLEIKKFITEDRVFGIMHPHKLEDFVDNTLFNEFKNKAKDFKGVSVVYGVGAALAINPDIYVYADLARWEIQQRYRSGMCNWKCNNSDEDNLKKFKRGYFFEWRIADKYKKARFDQFDYVLDTTTKEAKMISGEIFLDGLKQATKQPFRVVPFFDPGVWGGQWMKDKCNLDKSAPNYAWSFDGVPE